MSQALAQPPTDLRAAGDELGIPFASTVAGRLPLPAFVREIPIAYARQHSLMAFAPIRQDEPPTLAIGDPANLDLLDVVCRFLGVDLDPVFAPPPAIQAAINAAYEQQTGQAQAMIESLRQPPVGAGAKAPSPTSRAADRNALIDEVRRLAAREDLLDNTARAPVIRLVNLLLFEAVQSGASDVHIQPYEARLMVRTRVDGVLYDSFELPKTVQEEIIGRVKIIGRMNVAEKRLAQDGRATVAIGDRSVDLRIASLPTSFGERVVIRLLDKSARLYDLAELGMDEQTLSRFGRLVSAEHGLILVTGPTGSGKSTTLYSALRRINSTEKNVLTLEDPIEYQLDGISQTQVTDRKGMTFASGLRSVLRQDPDVIMVGEIRDRETASMAIQSALTGHLVFSTLHTNDAPSAVTRLMDLGIEPYLVASSLRAVLAQRLVRKVCTACAARVKPTPAGLKWLGVDTIERTSGMRRGRGCDTCRKTGYRGRFGMFELLVVDEPIRRLITTQAAAGKIKEAAIAAGMRTLREDGVAKVLAGLTTIGEVERVTLEGEEAVELV